MDVEGKVKDWDCLMKSLPTFEEIRDVEFVRRSGTINMITGDLVGELYRRGRYRGVAWVLRCRENHTSWFNVWDIAMKDAVEKHGEANTWFTSELIESWEDFELELEEERLKQKMNDIKKRRLANRSNDSVE